MSNLRSKVESVMCYSCKNTFDYDFYALQAERTKYMYTEVREHPDQPRNYYVRCPECEKFNRVRH